ncbi:unnamed protein product [Rhizophagus irregularis]|nr:unnamed protein product [Rhizophagus irregularis]CAB5371867.1 unnamed protein product [Rhizophagus irregularis]
MSNEPKASPETYFHCHDVGHTRRKFSLDRLKKDFLKKEFDELEHVGRNKIECFLGDTSLRSGTILTEDTTTDENPLVVRYPLSETSIEANLRFVNNRKEVCTIEHTTGSFNKLQIEAKARFETLDECTLSDIYFECKIDKKEMKIENAYHFNLLVKKFKRLDQDELSLDLKVLIRNRKSYSDWKLEEVLQDVYHYESGILESVSNNFNMEDLPQLSPPLNDEVLNKIVEQLNDKKFVFDKVHTNEATAREFISVILVNAVCFVKKNIDTTAMLMVEKQIVGSHGYGPLDYVIMIQKFFVLVTEAKPSDPLKGIGQALAQMDSMSEILGKRKFDQTDLEYESIETMPIIGIVTTGRSWIFIRHTHQARSRRLEVSSEFECKFTGNNIKDDIKVVFSYVVQLLQAQIRELEQRKSKRIRV